MNKLRFFISLPSCMLVSTIAWSEIILSTNGNNFKSEQIYLINYAGSPHLGPTYKDTCLSITGLTWELIPYKSANEACYNPYLNMETGTDTWYCADGTVSYFNPWSACNSFKTCPDPTWELSEDGTTCSRPDFSCVGTALAVDETKLLAALIYAEASTQGNEQEMFAIGSVLVRMRDQWKKSTINDLVVEKRGYSKVVYDGNARFREVMCDPDPSNHLTAYAAAANALDYGYDYSNGACWWDGYDLKTKGKKAYRYKLGFVYSDPLHNIFPTPQSSARTRTSVRGNYDYVYETTSAFGNTIFFRYTDDYIYATRSVQCH